MKKSILIIVIGILLLAIDIQIPLGKAYPQMMKAEDLGEVFQGKVINNFIGTRPSIDVVPDLLGFVLIFIGCMFLIKENKRFIIAMLLVPVAIYLQIVIPQLAYHFQARDLYLKAAGYNFLIVGVEIAVEFFVIHGLVNITNSMQNKWHNNELLAGWITAMMSKGLLVGIDFFFGQKVFYYIYSLIMIAATFVYLNRLYVTTKFKLEVNE
jgi:hypothetical protein